MSLNTLVTAIGSLSAHAVVTAVQRLGWTVIGCDIYPREWLAGGEDVRSFYRAPRGNSNAYIEFILDVVQKEKINYLIPLTDVEVDVLSMHRNDLEKAGAVLCLSSAWSVATCRNKFVFQKTLKDHGLKCTIPTYTSKDMEAHAVWRQSSVWVGKPVNGRSSEGLRKIRSREQFLRLLPDIDTSNYIFQPYIWNEDSHVVTVDVIRQAAREAFVAMPRRELLRTNNGAGTTVEIFRSNELVGLCKEIADILDILGCVNFEFIETNGRYYILECNPRFSGGVGFSCLSGYNFVENHLRCFFGKKIDELPENYVQHIMTRRHELIVTKKGEGL